MEEVYHINLTLELGDSSYARQMNILGYVQSYLPYYSIIQGKKIISIYIGTAMDGSRVDPIL